MARPFGPQTLGDIESDLRQVEQRVIEQIARDLEAARQETIDRLAQLTGTFDLVQAQQILAEIERQQAQLSILWEQLFQQALEDALEGGAEMAAARTIEVGLELTVKPFISNTFLQVAATTLPDLIKGLQAEYVAEVGRMLRHAVLAGSTPLDIIRQLTRLPPFQTTDPRTGKLRPLTERELQQAIKRKGPHAKLFRRLESIARSEIGRITQTANYLNLLELSSQDDRWRKEWHAVGDMRTRDTHMHADGQVQPVNKPFIVGGHRLAYPGDPRAPASETVNCRCVSLPYHPVFDEPETVGEQGGFLGMFKRPAPSLKVRDIIDLQTE